MKNLGLVVFGRTDSAKMAGTLGLTPNQRGFLQDPRKNVDVHCEGCGATIHEDGLGAAMHGSRLYYCERPACLGHYAATQLRKDRQGKRLPYNLDRSPTSP